MKANVKRSLALCSVALLLISCTAHFEDSRQRSLETIVQDAVAQMPAKTAEAYSEAMADLLKTAPKSVCLVADMMASPAHTANSPMEYAISGLVNYVNAPGATGKFRVAKGLKAAIKNASDPTVEAFLYSQLRMLKPNSVKPSDYMGSYEVETSEEAAAQYAIESAAASDVFVLSEEERQEGFEILFDGTNLSQWTGNKEGYLVDNGTIKVTANYGNEENLYTAKEYKDFIFRFEFFFEKPAVNNGVGIRTPHGVDAAYDAMCEVQILDHDAPVYKDLKAYQVHGSAYGIIPAKRLVHKPLGEWSTEEIVVNGDNIKVTVNGEVILDGNLRDACRGHNVAPDGSDQNPYTVDHRNHPGMFREKGYISFCGHGEGLRFRNIRVKEL